MTTVALATYNLAHNTHALNCAHPDLHQVRALDGTMVAWLCVTCDRQLPVRPA